MLSSSAFFLEALKLTGICTAPTAARRWVSRSIELTSSKMMSSLRLVRRHQARQARSLSPGLSRKAALSFPSLPTQSASGRTSPCRTFPPSKLLALTQFTKTRRSTRDSISLLQAEKRSLCLAGPLNSSIGPSAFCPLASLARVIQSTLFLRAAAAHSFDFDLSEI